MGSIRVIITVDPNHWIPRDIEIHVTVLVTCCVKAFRRFENEPWVAFHCNAFQARYFLIPQTTFLSPPKKGLERVKTMLESTWRFF